MNTETAFLIGAIFGLWNGLLIGWVAWKQGERSRVERHNAAYFASRRANGSTEPTPDLEPKQKEHR